MKHLINNIVFLIFLLATQLESHLGQSKTLQSSNSSRTEVVEGARRLDNFVEFTDEGDQLAVESSGLGGEDISGNKRKILGSQQTSSTTKNGSRQCNNVQKAVYPILPVIVAALVGLIGSIIISGIIRLIYKSKREHGHPDLDSGYGYEKRDGAGYNLFGYDLKSIDLVRLAKNVLTAIDKVY